MGAVTARAAADESCEAVDADSSVSVDGCTRNLIEQFGDDGGWIEREMKAGTCPQSSKAYSAAESVYGKVLADAWLLLTVLAVASLWTWAAAETIWCDIVLRGIMQCRKAKSFSLARLHSLPPWLQACFKRREDGKAECTMHDLRDDVRAAGLPVPSDHERHQLSPWRDAAFDLEGSTLGPLQKEEVRNTLRKWAKAHNVSTQGGKGQVHKLLWDTVHAGQAMPQEEVVATGSSPSDLEAASGALRLHADVNDDRGMHTHVKELRDVLFGGAWLTADVPPSATCPRPPQHYCCFVRPHLESFRAPPTSGELVGQSVVVFFNIALLLLVFVTQRCRIHQPAAWLFFMVYAVYVLYQVGWAPSTAPSRPSASATSASER